MITSIRLVNFKNFADETLRVGPFTIIVGANASGKSNIRDAFRFLHGIGRGYTLAEIIGGKYGPGGQLEWAPIRGAADEIIRFGQHAFSLEVEVKEGRYSGSRYSIEVSMDKTRPGLFRVTREELHSGWMAVYTSHPGGNDPVTAQDDDTHLLLRMEKTRDQRKYGHRIAVRPDQPALTQLREHRRVIKDHKDRAENIIRILANMRFLDLVPDQMRKPAFPGQTVLGDGGENLPTVLREICDDPGRREVLAEWTRELTPMDVQDFEFPADRITGLIQLVFQEANHRKVSAYGASDGTLRFLAMLAALLGSKAGSLYFFEEIDTGIHPARQSLLLELIEGQTARNGVQILTTTHAPDLLTFASDSTFENMSVVCRLEDTHDAIIRPVAELPNARELRTAGRGLGGLLAEGWMETALAFTENNGEAREGGE